MTLRHLLIANRGEIALRILRSARARGLRTTAIYSEADAHAPHVRAADLAVPVGPAPVGQSYLNIPAVIEAARKTGADAVHPGYGLLSENADFARACAEAGLVFVGPSPESIALMADKRAARQAALRADVPCVPGFEGGDGELSEFVEAARELGYPVMVKAAAGGGGRGMRRVDDEAAMPDALAAAAREAQAAFGDGRLLLEKLIDRGRHIEIQVLADAHGHAIHLGERDCSVQRRFQKVLEESPSPAVDPALRERMGEAALRLVHAAGYVGAGTVELMLDADGEHFYFLEMNTRLQVEHPVTEMVAGVDLVALQLAVAAGEPLPLRQQDVVLQGHAIEARLYAEDPAAGFLPQTGLLTRVAFPEGPHVRVDHGLGEGLEISAHYDPMLAKVIAHGANRAEALARLDAALRETRVLGLRHNRDFLRRIVGDQDFVQAQVHTGWLTQEGEALAAQPAPEPLHWAVAALALLLAGEDNSRDFGELRGFCNARPLRFAYTLASDGRSQSLELWCLDSAYEARLDDRRVRLEAPRHDRTDGSLEVVCEGVLRRFGLHLEPHPADGQGPRIQLDDGQSVDIRDRSRLPPQSQQGPGSGHIASGLEGLVVEVRTREGAHVQRGDVLLVLEAMKMQNHVTADVDGQVRTVAVREGQTVGIGQRLVEIEPQAP